jgi:transposase
LKFIDHRFLNYVIWSSGVYLLIPMDNASWHKSKGLVVPENITLFYLPPYTPEMNPTEQVWKELRKDGFKNTLFGTLNDVIDKLSSSVMSLAKETIKSVCGRAWIMEMF